MVKNGKSKVEKFVVSQNIKVLLDGTNEIENVHHSCLQTAILNFLGNCDKHALTKLKVFSNFDVPSIVIQVGANLSKCLREGLKKLDLSIFGSDHK